MRRDRRYLGPDRDDSCPCGSHRRARSCHGRTDGGWRADPWRPHVGGSPTGHAHSGCYARTLGDCSSKLSREHYISAAILDELGGNPLLSGLSFLEGSSKRLPTSALAAKILCERHNSRLSPLDTEALRALRALRRFDTDLKDSAASPEDDFELIDGPRLEAWLLKTFFGLLAKRLLTGSGHPLAGWRQNAEPVLLAVLFEGGTWPDQWGLWVDPPAEPVAAAADLALGTFGREGQVWGAVVEFGAFPIHLMLGQPGTRRAVYRPGGLVVLKQRADVEKVLAIGWPEGWEGPPVVSTRVGQMNGWDTSREGA